MRIGTSERYEIRARAFRAMTGYFPPGKDAPAASNICDAELEAARLAWDTWSRVLGPAVNATINAMAEYLEETRERGDE